MNSVTGKSMKQTDYYEILQVSPKADVEVIKAAFKRLALKYHPDSGGTTASHEVMTRLNEAYTTLVDPNSRLIYDQSRAQPIDQSNPKSESLIYSSDFSVASENWAEVSNEHGKTYRELGFYCISVPQVNHWQYQTIQPYERFVIQDFKLEVEAEIVSGNDTFGGVIFRHRMFEKWGIAFYRIAYKNNGMYAVQIFFGKKWIPLVEWRYTNIIRTNAINKLSMSITGETMEFHINDIPLTSVQDDWIDTGNFGFFCGAGNSPSGGVMRWRNLRVFKI